MAEEKDYLSAMDPSGESQEPDTEIEETADEQIDDAEDQAEVEQDQDSEVESDSEQDDKPIVTGMDKALQKIQQRQSAYESHMKDLGAKMEAILAKIESQGGKATEAQKERLEELQDDLADGQGDEFATIKDLKQFQREARKQALEEFRAEAAAIRQAEEAARRQNESWVESYVPSNPVLAGKNREILDEYLKEVSSFSSYSRMNDTDRTRFEQLALYKAEQTLASKYAKRVDQRKPSNIPDKSTDGTKIVKSGATAAKPKGKTEDDYLAAMNPLG